MQKKVTELVEQDFLEYAQDFKVLRVKEQGRFILNKLILELASSLEPV